MTHEAEVHDPEAVLIGCALEECGYVQRAVGNGIKPAAFSDPLFRAAFEAAIAASTVAKPNESLLITVLEAIKPQCEDASRLSACASRLRTPSAQFPDAVRGVLAAWSRRRAADTLTLGLAELRDGKPARDVVEAVQSRLHEVAQGHERGRFRPTNEIVDEVAASIVARLAGRDEGAVCGWNVPTLDRSLRQFRRGELILVGGRPGAGKSALASWVSLHAAQAGRRCAFFSLEMPAGDIVARMGEQLGRVCITTLATSPHDHHERLANSLKRISQMRDTLAIVDHERTLDGIISRAELLTARGGLDLLVVDYAQRVNVPLAKGQLRDAAIGQVSDALKGFALRNRVAVLLVVALNRASETENREPGLCDLRESGQLEYDADLVALLHRAAPQANPSDSVELGVIVPKNRGGPTGKTRCNFHGPTKTFTA
jgi:replicative DNA helicase